MRLARHMIAAALTGGVIILQAAAAALDFAAMRLLGVIKWLRGVYR